jgi:hypothetical protein
MAKVISDHERIIEFSRAPSFSDYRASRADRCGLAGSIRPYLRSGGNEWA